MSKGSNNSPMIAYDIVEKKRHRQANTRQEIEYLVTGFVKGEIPDYMMSAWLMAVCMGGMTNREIYDLTEVMMNSGDKLTFDSVVVDKHSTGGVSDSTSLILVPILASLGVDIAKMSGRALGFTGGTIDKVEVFDGYKADRTQSEFKALIKKNHGTIVSQSATIAPADKLIYALRDKTATVDSIPLIASSIMSKKLASGASIILLDVKFGSGAFMKTLKDAKRLAHIMVDIGTHFGRSMEAVVTNMDSPLGTGVGCVYEVRNILDALDGKESDLLTLAKDFATRLLCMAKHVDKKTAIHMVDESISSKSARKKLDDIISASGGDIKVADNLPQSKYKYEIKADRCGYIKHVDAYKIAKVVQHLTELSTNKKCEGVVVLQIGDKVQKDGVIATIYSENKITDETKNEVRCAIQISSRPTKKKLIYKVIKGEK